MLVISFFSKRFQRSKGKSRFKELQAVENLAQADKFDEALREIDTLESQGVLQENIRIYSQFLKSSIYLCKNEYEKGLTITEQLLTENLDFDAPFFQIDIVISKVNALLALGNFEKCNEAVKVAETLLGKIDHTKKEVIMRQITLNNLKSQLLRKRGEYDLASDSQKNSHFLRDDYTNPLQLGTIHATRGEYEVATQIFQESLSKYSKSDDTQSIIRLNNNLGLVYANSGYLDQAVETLQNNSDLIKKIGNKSISATHLNNLGITYFYGGELTSALDYCNKSVAVFKNLGCKYEEAIVQNNLGSIHAIRGELNLALELFESGIEWFSKLGAKSQASLSKVNQINVQYQLRGNFEATIADYETNLKSLDEKSNNLDLSILFLNIISVQCKGGLIDEAKSNLVKLEQIRENDTTRNKIIIQLSKLAKALILKSSGRVVKKAEAEQLFMEIISEELIHSEVTLLAAKNLCDLLFKEFRSSGSEEVLDEIKKILRDFLEKAEKNASYSLLIETYLLQSKIALLELDLNTARRLLSKAQQISEEKAPQFGIRIASDYDSLLDQSEKWKDFSDRTLTERLEMDDLENRVTKLIRKKAEVSDLPKEIPDLFMILGRSGMSMFSKHFASESTVSEQLIGGFLTAINAFTEQAFSQQGTIEGIKHKEHTILLVPVESFLCCYIFKGQSYFALRKLKKFAETMGFSDIIKDRLTEASHLGLEVSEDKMIQDFVENVFVSFDESISEISLQTISPDFFSQNMTIPINSGIYLDPEISYLKEYL